MSRKITIYKSRFQSTIILTRINNNSDDDKKYNNFDDNNNEKIER